MKPATARKGRAKCPMFLLLLLAIAVQVAVRAGRFADSQSIRKPSIAVGDTLLSLTGVTIASKVATVNIASDSVLATVLYVFHPECVHGLAVAPIWATHFSNASTDNLPVRRIAVTSVNLSIARNCAAHANWRSELLSISLMSTALHVLLARTPWMLVFDSDGVLRYDGHGSRLMAANDAVRDVVKEEQQTRPTSTGRQG